MKKGSRRGRLGLQKWSGSVRGTVRERIGRHRVHPHIYMLSSTSGGPLWTRSAPQRGSGAVPIPHTNRGDKREGGGGQKGPEMSARRDRTLVDTPPWVHLWPLRSLMDPSGRPSGRLRRNKSSQIGPLDLRRATKMTQHRPKGGLPDGLEEQYCRFRLSVAIATISAFDRNWILHWIHPAIPVRRHNHKDHGGADYMMVPRPNSSF